MSNMNPKDAQDAAFDARCPRSSSKAGRWTPQCLLESPFRCCRTEAGNKGIRIAALALVIAGTAAWGVYRSDAPDPISEETPAMEAEAPSEISGVSTPDATQFNWSPLHLKRKRFPLSPGAEPEPVVSSSPSGSSNEPGVMPAAERVGVPTSRGAQHPATRRHGARGGAQSHRRCAGEFGGSAGGRPHRQFPNPILQSRRRPQVKRRTKRRR